MIHQPSATDSLGAAQFIVHGVPSSHRYANMVSLILNLLSRPWTASVQHVFREGNRCADLLAKLGVNLLDRFVVLLDPPSELDHLLVEDAFRRVVLRT
ncbi:Reverse transcriptase-like [Sesbania bispinosa]|nr:Reverse transcriptase-like [Sesbania bispinosa]